MGDSSSDESDFVRNLRPKRTLGTYVDEDLQEILRCSREGIKKCHEKLKEDWRKEEKKDSDSELKEPKTDEDYSDREKDDQGQQQLPVRRGRTRRPKGRSISTIIRMRRTRFRNQLPTNTEPTIYPITKSSLEFEELIYRVGDVVKVRTSPSSSPSSLIGQLNCYAQIRGFYRDQFCGKYAALQWLYPTQPKELSLQNPMDIFDPAYFVQGQSHPEPVELGKLIFVTRISSDLVHKNPHDQRLLITKDGKKEYMDGVSCTISSSSDLNISS